jgi:predicted dehydrogenase
MLRVGVIGVGHLGRFHTRVYSVLSSCELVGVYDDDRTRSGVIADEFSTRAFDSMSELLNGVEAVSIAVPTMAHHRVGLQCLKSGVHTLIEKPIASTVSEAEELVAAAEERDLRLQIGHIERFNQAIRAALREIDSPMFVEAHRLGVFAPRGTDVPVVLDLMIHDIDLILAAVDSSLERIDAVGVPILSPNVDIANARLTFADGCVANLTASRVSRERTRKIRFFQSDAYISVDCMAPKVEIFRKKDVSPERLLEIATGKIEGGLDDVVDFTTPAMDGADALEMELASFLRSVSAGESPAVSGEDGLKALEVATEILRQIG